MLAGLPFQGSEEPLQEAGAVKESRQPETGNGWRAAACLQAVNPKGIPSLSPGLRGTSYPGCDRGKDSPTLKGLEHLTGTAAARPSRNNLVGSGERTRPACCQRRPAVGLAFPLVTHRLVIQSGRRKFAAGRRKPHAGGMCSPLPTAWIWLRPAPCCNPFRVEHDSGMQPKVARGSQLWAGEYNPFGIERPFQAPGFARSR
jgi:hypothetical protein